MYVWVTFLLLFLLLFFIRKIWYTVKSLTLFSFFLGVPFFTFFLSFSSFTYSFIHWTFVGWRNWQENVLLLYANAWDPIEIVVAPFQLMYRQWTNGSSIHRKIKTHTRTSCHTRTHMYKYVYVYVYINSPSLLVSCMLAACLAGWLNCLPLSFAYSFGLSIVFNSPAFSQQWYQIHAPMKMSPRKSDLPQKLDTIAHIREHHIILNRQKESTKTHIHTPL